MEYMSPRILRLARIRNRPRPASRQSHHVRYKGRWQASRAAHGEEGQWAQHRFGPLSPPRSEPAWSPAPPRGRDPGALWDPNPPALRLGGRGGRAGSAGAHAEVGRAPAAPALGPGAQGPSARRPPHGCSYAPRAPASPELWGMKTRGKGAVRAGGPDRASWPRPGEGSPASRRGSGHPPAEREVPGELGEAAGAGPALRGRDLGAGNDEERPRLLVCAAPASPGREFDFRVWPQVGHGEHKAREKSARGAGAAARSLLPGGRPPCSTLFL